jgi:hypothetical protein
MGAKRRAGAERIPVGGGGLGLALLGTLGTVVAGWLPWPALPAAWLGGNAAFLLLLGARATRDAEGGRDNPCPSRRCPADPTAPPAGTQRRASRGLLRPSYPKRAGECANNNGR